MDNYREVIIVDKYDHQLRTMELMEAHKEGYLHRAISVFIFNSEGDWLLQKRANNKYHSAGLWSNTCCTHPFPGESVEEAAKRRLNEEMGMSDIKFQKLYSFIYQAVLDNGLKEHELDHVFVGYSNNLPDINKTEVEEFNYFKSDKLMYDLNAHPENFTVWLQKSAKRVVLECACKHVLYH